MTLGAVSCALWGMGAGAPTVVAISGNSRSISTQEDSITVTLYRGPSGAGWPAQDLEDRWLWHSSTHPVPELGRSPCSWLGEETHGKCSHLAALPCQSQSPPYPLPKSHVLGSF